MKKTRLLSLILIAVLLTNLLGIMPITVLAEDVPFPKQENGVYLIEDYEQLQMLAEIAYRDTSAKLTRSIHRSDATSDNVIVLNKLNDLALDLNGFTLSRSTNSTDTSLFRVDSGSSLSIYDSSDKENWGTCQFSNKIMQNLVSTVNNMGGDVTINGGNYLVTANTTCTPVLSSSGTTHIKNGFFDARGGGSLGVATYLVHWNEYSSAPIMTIDSGTFIGDDCVKISPYGNFTSAGCTYPVAFVLGGDYYCTSDDEYSSFAYCSNGWGAVYVAGGTIPQHSLNPGDVVLVEGAEYEEITKANPYGGDTKFHKVSTPPVLYDLVTRPYTRDLVLERACRQWLEYYTNPYRNFSAVVKQNPDLFELLEQPRSIVVDKNYTDDVELFIYPNALQKTTWWQSTDQTSWTKLGQFDGKTSITIPRPEEACTMYYRFETGNNDTSCEDALMVHYAAKQKTTVLDTIEFHINAPEDGQRPSEQIYIDPTTLGGYSASTFHWVDKTAGGLVNTFVAGHEYEVQVVLKAEEDFAFATNGSNSALKAFCNYNQATVNTVGGTTPDQTVRVTYNFGKCPAVISTANVELCPPVAGAQRDLHPKVGNQNFTVNNVDWYDQTIGRFMEQGELFQNGHHYTVQVWLEIDDGFEFNNDDVVPQVKGTINGNPAPVTKAYEQALDEMVVLNYDFGICDSVIDSVNIVEVSTPVAGENPISYAETQSDDYYVHSIYWSGPDGTLYDSDQFVEGVTYEAAIQLLPKKYGSQPLFTFAANTRAYVNNLPADRVVRSGNSLIVYASYTCESTFAIGDVNLDGKIAANDALEVLKSVVGKVILTTGQQTAADTDGNGKVEAKDALNILKKVVGKLDKFPVEA